MEDHHQSDDRGKTKRLLRCFAFTIPEVKADENEGTTTEISEVGGGGDEPLESETGGVLGDLKDEADQGGSVTEITEVKSTHKKAEEKGEIVEEEDLDEVTRKIFRQNWQQLRDRVVKKVIINSQRKGSHDDDEKETREDRKTVGIVKTEAAGVQEFDKVEKSSMKSKDSAGSTSTDKRQGEDEEEGEGREENKDGTCWCN